MNWLHNKYIISKSFLEYFYAFLKVTGWVYIIGFAVPVAIGCLSGFELFYCKSWLWIYPSLYYIIQFKKQSEYPLSSISVYVGAGGTLMHSNVSLSSQSIWMKGFHFSLNFLLFWPFHPSFNIMPQHCMVIRGRVAGQESVIKVGLGTQFSTMLRKEQSWLKSKGQIYADFLMGKDSQTCSKSLKWV